MNAARPEITARLTNANTTPIARVILVMNQRQLPSLMSKRRAARGRVGLSAQKLERDRSQKLTPSSSSCKPSGVIPSPIDQNPCAHWRSPMDMMRQG